MAFSKRIALSSVFETVVETMLRSFSELFLQLQGPNEERSQAMRIFQARTTREVIAFWERALAALLEEKRVRALQPREVGISQ